MAKARDLPSVSRLLGLPEVETLVREKGRTLVTALLRRLLAAEREKLRQQPEAWQAPDWMAFLQQALHEHHAAHTVRAVNGTGILLHTGLGRAPLAHSAVEALVRECSGATQLEIDPVTGGRSVRDAAGGKLLNEIFGGQGALVVNNNAAATLLALHALAAGREVVVSRGELIEIGGSFRLPEIMVQSQVRLTEVGATNKQRLGDFAGALNENTGLIFKAHTSNYRIEGFTAEVPLADLVTLGQERGIPVVHDIGSGAIVDMTQYGLPAEPLARESLKAGADLVLFSGDKLLGGPQCGILLGRADLIEKCRQNPLARALRVDKLTLAALEATLELIREDRQNEIPLYQRLGWQKEVFLSEAKTLAGIIAKPFTATVEDAAGEMGSGSVPGVVIPSWRVVLQHPHLSADDIASALRSAEVPVYGTINDGRFGLNVLALPPEEHQFVVDALRSI